MSLSMLEYSKIILEKVSFDAHLFQREFRKAISKLLPSDANELIEWCMTRYGEKLPMDSPILKY